VKEAAELERRTGIGVEKNGCLSKNLDGKVNKNEFSDSLAQSLFAHHRPGAPP
jgi:hypothetical protein